MVIFSPSEASRSCGFLLILCYGRFLLRQRMHSAGLPLQPIQFLLPEIPLPSVCCRAALAPSNSSCTVVRRSFSSCSSPVVPLPWRSRPQAGSVHFRELLYLVCPLRQGFKLLFKTAARLGHLQAEAAAWPVKYHYACLASAWLCCTSWLGRLPRGICGRNLARLVQDRRQFKTTIDPASAAWSAPAPGSSADFRGAPPWRRHFSFAGCGFLHCGASLSAAVPLVLISRRHAGAALWHFAAPRGAPPLLQVPQPISSRRASSSAIRPTIALRTSAARSR